MPSGALAALHTAIGSPTSQSSSSPIPGAGGRLAWPNAARAAAIGVGIGDTPPAQGFPFQTPAGLADSYWQLASPPETPEFVVTD